MTHEESHLMWLVIKVNKIDIDSQPKVGWILKGEFELKSTNEVKSQNKCILLSDENNCMYSKCFFLNLATRYMQVAQFLN